jgi:hypothetical protein
MKDNRNGRTSGRKNAPRRSRPQLRGMKTRLRQASRLSKNARRDRSRRSVRKPRPLHRESPARNRVAIDSVAGAAWNDAEGSIVRVTTCREVSCRRGMTARRARIVRLGMTACRARIVRRGMTARRARIAGRVRIGRRAKIAGHVRIVPRAKIAEHVTIVPRARHVHRFRCHHGQPTKPHARTVPEEIEIAAGAIGASLIGASPAREAIPRVSRASPAREAIPRVSRASPAREAIPHANRATPTREVTPHASCASPTRGATRRASPGGIGVRKAGRRNPGLGPRMRTNGSPQCRTVRAGLNRGVDGVTMVHAADVTAAAAIAAGRGPARRRPSPIIRSSPPPFLPFHPNPFA